ncbi:MAG: hydantoinase/oxoprolinase family protein [Nitriliruptorales bacterium]|nr:hydantoinase/oxoprolinase family protein [Nitriliruptorales bacterium]
MSAAPNQAVHDVRYTLGVDTGGTFTDIVAIDRSGTITSDKAFSTPPDPAQGVLAALAAVAVRLGIDRSTLLSRTDRFVHGTTVSTNALITRRGSRVGLLTTRGFEDTLVIGRGPMGRTGGIPYQQAMDFARTSPPPPLVPRSLVRGVNERVGRDGAVLVGLDTDDLRRQLEDLLAAGTESLAVCLLWSFKNPAHEEAILDFVTRVHPALPVSLSCHVSPTLGEFERAMTTAVNAYVGRITRDYIASLSAALRQEGLARPIELMKASGGCCLPDDISREAVAIINSGPVGGLVGARAVGGALGIDNIITTDMGGTSFDVGLIRNGEFENETLSFADQGIPVRTSAVRLATVGAGGGSIAWTDGLRLRVGPHSAGADPGPACYGKGGSEPTVTDALIVLGIIDPSYFFGGRFALDPQLAEKAIRERAADPLGIDVREAAAGIVEIVNARMADLIRKATVESGWDPRDFTVWCYGGAGPAHCASFGSILGIKEIVIPDTSPVFSAFGVALSDLRYSYVRSEQLPVSDDGTAIRRTNEVFDELERAARRDVAVTRGPDAPVEVLRRIDIRYKGQLNDLTIAWGPDLTNADAVRRAFNEAYASRFGSEATRDVHPLELTAHRLDVVQPSSTRLEWRGPPAEPQTEPGGAPAPAGTRDVYVRGTGMVPTSVYRSDGLRPGHALTGPCLIERPDTTVYVPAGKRLTMDPQANFRIRTG